MPGISNERACNHFVPISVLLERAPTCFCDEETELPFGRKQRDNLIKNFHHVSVYTSFSIDTRMLLNILPKDS